MRGKVYQNPVMQALDGITPAYAGKSKMNTDMFTGCRDHPRVCGEKSELSSSLLSYQGSPPRMRGKGERKTGKTRRVGITPAYAGKRLREGAYQARGEDHPRVCGEKSVFPPLLRFVQGSPPRMRGKGRKQRATIQSIGSPPRMRGKVGAVVCGVVYSGITPAYAGKRPQGGAYCVVCWDHPRVCGEKIHQRQFLFIYRGSPPRMRGKD